MKCRRGHAEPVNGCFSCRMVGKSDLYRAAVAKSRGERPPAGKVGEPERKSRQERPKPPGRGPGTNVVKMTEKLGVPTCQACLEYAKRMDLWGSAECRRRFEEIALHLERQAESLGWFKYGLAGLHAIWHGVPLTARGILEKAIADAEAEERAEPLYGPPAAG